MGKRNYIGKLPIMFKQSLVWPFLSRSFFGETKAGHFHREDQGDERAEGPEVEANDLWSQGPFNIITVKVEVGLVEWREATVKERGSSRCRRGFSCMFFCPYRTHASIVSSSTVNLKKMQNMGRMKCDWRNQGNMPANSSTKKSKTNGLDMRNARRKRF